MIFRLENEIDSPINVMYDNQRCFSSINKFFGEHVRIIRLIISFKLDEFVSRANNCFIYFDLLILSRVTIAMV